MTKSLSERASRFSGVEYEAAELIDPRVMGEYVFAREPNFPPVTFSDHTQSDSIVGERPLWEQDFLKDVQAKAWSIVVAQESLYDRAKFSVSKGWDGKSGLIAYNKGVYEVFVSTLSCSGRSDGHLTIEQIDPASLAINYNRPTYLSTENSIVLHLWEFPVAGIREGRVQVLVPRRWSGTVEVQVGEKVPVGGLIADMAAYVNRKASGRPDISVWQGKPATPAA
jgi:hypothetical protein